MTAPAAPAGAPPKRPVERLTYRGYHPFLFSVDEEVRGKARGRALGMRDESRILHLAKDTYDRTRRWVAETNRKGEAAAYLDFTNLAVAPRERQAFMPRDRLHIEVERHEQVFNPDPIAGTGSSGKLPTGVVFMGVTDFREAVANFDLRPLLEAFVRRMSATTPEYVWQIGDHHYWRTNGYLFADGRWEPRRFPVPKQVVLALGPLPPVAPATCVICGKADERVSPTPDPTREYAHNACLDSGAPARTPDELDAKREAEAKAKDEGGKLKFRAGG